MQAWVVDVPAAIDAVCCGGLQRELPSRPGTGPGLGVTGCGACRTDLHLAFSVRERIRAVWLGGSDASCRYCRRGAEKLCIGPAFTG